ncbi:hypothetical protein BN7_4749 [Wickerhamomyces ciferrii]|uniref:Uncharacterized protein n=1 Tax=Wickerhamomyces ciferrii (strain ATCC 14091 / BCRC 22168 / CBS 111 / JCM 3599 / NBRC 0793 / NRRL Y-1031 F-60-10) TaxID=1206466 RepID=K0KVJ9_WICCF|nr:uncharacterized protein BN7_4749 [Wickerhamomyces ciferrii]CCH45168.1 hypothetical protein BN7_4749 [Wickerhamomyces ciferrii]
MGFFKPSKIHDEVSENTYEDNYVGKALRLPSAKEPYINSGFDEHFSNNKIETTTTDKAPSVHRVRSKRHSFFTKLFKKTTEVDPEEEGTRRDPLIINQQVEPYSNVRVIERELHSDESSILDLNLVNGEDLKPLKSTRLTWRSRRNKNQNSRSLRTNSNKFGSRRSTIRYFFRRDKELDAEEEEGDEDEEVEQAANTSSVYDVKETLTQRYMTPSGEGYDRLMDDLDNLPLEFTTNEPLTIHQKVSKLLHSLSPLRKSPKSSSIAKDDGSQPEYFNPYDIAKRYREEHNVFEDTDDLIDDDPDKDEITHVSRRASIFDAFRRSKSIKVADPIIEKNPNDVIDNAQNDNDQEEEPSIRRRISRKFSARSKRIPSESNFDTLRLENEDEFTKTRRNPSRRISQRSSKTQESKFEPVSNEDTLNEDPFSSDSSTTIMQNDHGLELFDKLYSKTLDAVELKNKIENDEDLSGSTRVDISIADSGDLTSKPLSGSGSGSPIQHNIVANFASVDNENTNSQRISSFLQTYYEPSRPSTKAISRRTSRSMSRAKDITTDDQNEHQIVEKHRPLTATEQYNKEVEENRLEMEELKFLINRNRSHHRKVINGQIDQLSYK